MKMSTDRDTDGGWAWVVLGMSTVCRVIEATVVISVGLFQVEFLKQFSGGISVTSLLTSTLISLQLILGPLSSFLCDIFSIRVTMMTGGVLFSLGFISASFTSTLTQLFVTFSIIGGCLYDVSQSYSIGFHVAGLFVLAGSFLLLLIPVLKVKDTLRVKDKPDTLLPESITLTVDDPSVDDNVTKTAQVLLENVRS